MADIRLQGVNKVYPGGTHAVHDVDLHIQDGEFMIMVGPSGCAKSTILRMIAGLETPTSGTIEIGGRVVNEVAPKDRDIAMVFQSYALYPHMTVRENMAFGLKLRKMPQGEIDQRVTEAAHVLGLEALMDRLPKAMSGGQRQRVAMGRAIVREPQAFLMDEPLSNLDAKLRVQMRTQIAKLHQRLQTTTVYVTHDQVEAMTLGQRICILRKGIVQQVDSPFQVYTNPANIFVGGFIGSPGMNFLSGHLVLHDGMVFLQLGEQHMPLPASVTGRLVASDIHGRGVVVGIRPEHLAEAAPGEADALPVMVDLVESMGAETYAYFSCGVSVPDLSELSDTQATSDTFVARLAPGTMTGAGDQPWLKLALEHVHLFDPSSQQSLLAPASEAEVAGRATHVSLAATPTMPMHQPAPHVAAPPQRQVHVQPVQPVIHLHQTFVNDQGGAPGATIDADPQRIAAVFEQPVATVGRLATGGLDTGMSGMMGEVVRPATTQVTMTQQMPVVPAHMVHEQAPQPPARSSGFAARPVVPGMQAPSQPQAMAPGQGVPSVGAAMVDGPAHHHAAALGMQPDAESAQADANAQAAATAAAATPPPAPPAPVGAFSSALARVRQQADDDRRRQRGPGTMTGLTFGSSVLPPPIPLSAPRPNRGDDPTASAPSGLRLGVPSLARDSGGRIPRPNAARTTDTAPWTREP